MEGFKIRCCTCGLVLYETTDRYTCHKPLTGDMLRLLPLYKDWPCYDGSLAVSSTSRFLMFCSQCAGYVANSVGGLRFADFKEGPHVVSQERSDMGYSDELFESIAAQMMKKSTDLISDFIGEVVMEATDNPYIPRCQDSALSDDPKRDGIPTVSPEDLIKEMEKQGNISRPGRSKKKGKR